jgi:hypothetical protein
MTAQGIADRMLRKYDRAEALRLATVQRSAARFMLSTFDSHPLVAAYAQRQVAKYWTRQWFWGQVATVITEN